MTGCCTDARAADPWATWVWHDHLDEQRSARDSRRPDTPLFHDHRPDCTGACCWDPRDAA